MQFTKAALTPGTLVTLCGPAGSGKSTLARRLAVLLNAEVISLDALRAQVSGGDPGDQSVTAQAVQLQNRAIEEALGLGHTLVLDSTNTDAAVRAELLERARRHGRPASVVALTTGLDECLRRNALRTDTTRVPDHVLRHQHDLATQALPGLRREGFAHVITYP